MKSKKLHKELLSIYTCLECLISVHQVDDTLDKTKDAWDTSPAKQKINYTWHYVAHVELVDTETTNQDSKNTCNHFILHNSRCFSRLRIFLSFYLGEQMNRHLTPF